MSEITDKTAAHFQDIFMSGETDPLVASILVLGARRAGGVLAMVSAATSDVIAS